MTTTFTTADAHKAIRSGSVNVPDKEGFTALHRAAQHGLHETIPALLAAGADPAARTMRYEKTPWQLATERGYHITARIIRTTSGIIA